MSLRETILARDNYSCVNCGNPAEEIHHIVPQSSPRSTNNLGNLVSFCSACHGATMLKTALKTKEGLLRARFLGKHLGNVPLGFSSIEGKLVLDELGKKVVFILQKNPQIRIVELSKILQINYKQAWNLFQSIKKFGNIPGGKSLDLCQHIRIIGKSSAS